MPMPRFALGEHRTVEHIQVARGRLSWVMPSTYPSGSIGRVRSRACI